MNTKLHTPIGILGGTFDPVHLGHLRMSLELIEALNLQEVRFIPCRDPVHKETVQASVADRLAMLRLAIRDQPGFILDERELQRDTPSYMVLTLESLQKDFPNQPLCLILGIDALAKLSTWHRWEDVLSLCHIIGVTRPDFALPESGIMARVLQEKRITNAKLLSESLAGHIYLKQTTLLDISSTEIRHIIAMRKSVRYLVPKAVFDYIEREGVYSK